METINIQITLSKLQMTWIKEQINSGIYINESEYFRALVRRDQEQKFSTQVSAKDQLRLARIYCSGDGIPMDNEKARELLVAAITNPHATDDEKESANVQMIINESALGDSCYRGKNDHENIVPQNYCEALTHYMNVIKLSEGSYTAPSYLDNVISSAMFMLGEMYRDGKGVGKNHQKAMYLFNLAESKCSTDSRPVVSLGDMYWFGEGVEENNKQAFAYYEKVTKFPEFPDYVKHRLAWLYETGFGGEQNDLKARFWYEEAVHDGDAESQLALGKMFIEGRGVPIDLKKARELLESVLTNPNADQDDKKSASAELKNCWGKG